MKDTYTGLTQREVEESRAKNGVNEIKPEKRPNFFKRVFDIIRQPMILLLVIAGSVYFVVGEFDDGAVMLISILGICIIEYLQQKKTDKALEELNKLSAIDVTVIRNGKKEQIDSKEVVVGDIVVLSEGDKIPADGIILEQEGLGTDESSLTGESAVVYKSVNEEGDSQFKLNMCYSGTNVTNGTAYIKITSVGKDTEFGKIGESLKSIKQEPSPLERQTNKLVLICAIISFSFFFLDILVNFIRSTNPDIGQRFVEALLAGLTVAMSTIPEEIPVILTVFLALGAWSLAKKKTLVRNNRAIETLGTISVLCTDKTGTLTENKMKVESTFAPHPDFLKSAYYACPETVYDPMEIAIKDYCSGSGINKNKSAKSIHDYIFTPETKMTGQVWEEGGHKTVYIKGAQEHVLKLCDLDAKTKAEILAKSSEFAKQGYRVIAVAKKDKITKIPEKITDNKLDFMGLIALVDPPRQSVQKSLKECADAGIRVIMITGDSGETAKGIADNIGLQHSGEFITGEQLEKMSDSELKQKVKTVTIFARVYPNHKMRIINALQANHEVVGMTGDGVNDAPALKKADVGIAMGNRGTTVAKEAADIVLLDDNFSTIVAAIKNGRTIYQNIKLSISYILAIHIPLAMLTLFVPLAGLPLLLLPIHVVITEFLLDPTSSLIFQRIKPNADIMRRAPRNPKEPIINRKTAIRCILQGLLIFAIVFCTYFYMETNGYEHGQATGVSFGVLVMSIMIIAYEIRSKKSTISNFIDCMRDKFVWLVNCATILIMIAIMYVPFFNKLAHTSPLSLTQWGMILLLSIIAVIPFDILKLINYLRHKNQKAD